MPHSKAAWALAGAITLAALPSAGTAQADPVADFYRGKTVNVLIGVGVGGEYDLQARLVARHIGKHIPGNPTVVVKNMPGAGGIVAGNHLYNAAERDGTVIACVQNNVPFEPLYGTKQAQYDATKFNWLGSPSTEVALITVWHTTPVNTVEDAKTYELKLGSSGANSTPSFYARLASEALGVKIKLVVGYPGQNEALLAMERGEIDGYPSAFYNSLMATRPTWIKEKKVKLLVQFGAAKESALPDVPFAPDLAKNPDDKLLIEGRRIASRRCASRCGRLSRTPNSSRRRNSPSLEPIHRGLARSCKKSLSGSTNRHRR
jgi:tripartite-type tricarboxylate transporter receptor subunit TctC